MDHPHAAQAVPACLADEIHHLLARLIGAQPVQVQLGLHRPVTPAQPRQRILSHTGAPEGKCLVRFQQLLDVDFVRQRLRQCLLLILLALTCLGRAVTRFRLAASGRPQGRHVRHLAPEDLRLGLEPRSLAPPSLGLGALGGGPGLHLASQPAQVFQPQPDRHQSWPSR